MMGPTSNPMIGLTDMPFLPPKPPTGFYTSPNQKTNTQNKFTFNPEQTSPNNAK